MSIKELNKGGRPSKAISVPITGMPHAKASITLTLIPAPVKQWGYQSFTRDKILYGIIYKAKNI